MKTYGLLPERWDEVELMSLASVITDGAHSSPKPQNQGRFMCSVKDMTYNKFDFANSKLISEEDYQFLLKQGCAPQKGDLLISKDGANCLDLLFLYKQEEDIVLLSSIAIVRLKESVCKEYVCYFLLSPDCQFIMRNNYVSGSAIPRVVLKDFKKVPIVLPPLPEQKAIASVLSSLDDKIDLLHSQNKTLEAMAETLFRQWFIEQAMEDWEEIQVKDYVTLNRSTLNKNYPFTEILYLDTGSLTKGVVSELQPYNLKEAPSRAKRLVQDNDVLISTVRPNQCHYGIVSRPKDNLVVSTGFCTITCNQISPYFIYLLLTSDDMTEYLHSVAEGSTSTYPSLKPEDIGALTFKLPPQDLMREFHRLAESYWKKIHMNLEQIQTLEQLRDTLLPKLMSGEVRVQYQIEEIS